MQILKVIIISLSFRMGEIKFEGFPGMARKAFVVMGFFKVGRRKGICDSDSVNANDTRLDEESGRIVKPGEKKL